MTDRELLELAAKAAGNGAQWDCPERGMLILSKSRCDTDSWNPLTDDGDALRLAVDLNIEFDNLMESCTAYQHDRDIDANEHHGSDKYAATRRAIVRAAAEIGRSMK